VYSEEKVYYFHISSSFTVLIMCFCVACKQLNDTKRTRQLPYCSKFLRQHIVDRLNFNISIVFSEEHRSEFEAVCT